MNYKSVDTPTKLTFDPSIELPVMEAFYTIQGEGFHSGRAAFFIRLAGCDIGCAWCDVKESWDAVNDQLISVQKIVADALAHPSKLAVITGGEPCMYDLTKITGNLKEAGFEINIETSGAYPFSGIADWICVSPKKFKAPLPGMLAKANELKVVIFHPSDFEWAEENAGSTPNGCRLYLQPEFDKRNKMVPLIVDYVKAHPQWNISLQSHKYIGIP
jgi:7-carboxy-7-deazaguanine synthase